MTRRQVTLDRGALLWFLLHLASAGPIAEPALIWWGGYSAADPGHSQAAGVFLLVLALPR